MRIKEFILTLVCVCLFCSCDGYMQTDMEDDLVIEGWIEENNYPIVMVTTSVLANELPAQMDSLSEHLVRWARVKISDGEKEVFLTGMKAKKHIPPYIYTTGAMKGEVGKVYSLTVDYGSVHAAAQTTIPHTVPIEGIRIQERDDSLRQVFIQFDDPVEEDNYYRIFVKVEKQDSTWFPSLFGLSNDSGFTGESELQVRRGYGNNMINFLSDFKKGEKIHVKLSTCTQEMYDYWKDFDNNMFYGRTPFFPANSNALGNLSGAYGYWTGYGSSSSVIDL